MAMQADCSLPSPTPTGVHRITCTSNHYHQWSDKKILVYYLQYFLFAVSVMSKKPQFQLMESDNITELSHLSKSEVSEATDLCWTSKSRNEGLLKHVPKDMQT